VLDHYLWGWIPQFFFDAFKWGGLNKKAKKNEVAIPNCTTRNRMSFSDEAIFRALDDPTITTVEPDIPSVEEEEEYTADDRVEVLMLGNGVFKGLGDPLIDECLLSGKNPRYWLSNRKALMPKFVEAPMNAPPSPPKVLLDDKSSLGGGEVG